MNALFTASSTNSDGMRFRAAAAFFLTFALNASCSSLSIIKNASEKSGKLNFSASSASDVSIFIKAFFTAPRCPSKVAFSRIKVSILRTVTSFTWPTFVLSTMVILLKNPFFDTNAKRLFSVSISSLLSCMYLLVSSISFLVLLRPSLKSSIFESTSLTAISFMALSVSFVSGSSEAFISSLRLATASL